MSTKLRNRVPAVFSAVLALALASGFPQLFAADKQKPYGVLFGTAYGPDDRPIYGVKVVIHPDGKSHPSWELHSDHQGEFAQRVPPGPADYVAVGKVDVIPLENGKPQKSKKMHLKGEARIHLAGEEWHDFSLHLQ